MSKYGAHKVHDPRWGLFDSESEYARWIELRVLFEAREIATLVRQPEFVLSESPRCIYTADAAYLEEVEPGLWFRVVEDVKPQGGVQSRDVFIRIAWLLNHPEHGVQRVRLLRKATARSEVKRGWRLVAGWLVKEYGVTTKKRRRAA